MKTVLKFIGKTFAFGCCWFALKWAFIAHPDNDYVSAIVLGVIVGVYEAWGKIKGKEAA